MNYDKVFVTNSLRQLLILSYLYKENQMNFYQFLYNSLPYFLLFSFFIYISDDKIKEKTIKDYFVFLPISIIILLLFSLYMSSLFMIFQTFFNFGIFLIYSIVSIFLLILFIWLYYGENFYEKVYKYSIIILPLLLISQSTFYGNNLNINPIILIFGPEIIFFLNKYGKRDVFIGYLLSFINITILIFILSSFNIHLNPSIEILIITFIIYSISIIYSSTKVLEVLSESEFLPKKFNKRNKYNIPSFSSIFFIIISILIFPISYFYYKDILFSSIIQSLTILYIIPINIFSLISYLIYIFYIMKFNIIESYILLSLFSIIVFIELIRKISKVFYKDYYTNLDLNSDKKITFTIFDIYYIKKILKKTILRTRGFLIKRGIIIK